jgi:predicted amidohydrolase
MCICNDRRWPETYRCLRLDRADLVLIGYNTPIGVGDGYDVDVHAPFHHLLVLQAGAYQNSLWIAAAAKAGNEEGAELLGHSAIVAPTGEVMALSSTREDELLVATCDLDAAEPFRSGVMNLNHRQPHTYERITAPNAGASASSRGFPAVLSGQQVAAASAESASRSR